jgi:hypothetical protein
MNNQERHFKKDDRTETNMCIQARVLHCPQKFLVFFKRAMYKGERIAVVASKTVIDQGHSFSLITDSKQNVYWFNVEMDYMVRVNVLE